MLFDNYKLQIIQKYIIQNCYLNYVNKNQKHTSSLEINSLLKVKPGINPLFLSQNTAAKLPEKNIPSTAANATNRSPKVALISPIHLSAQSAFFFTQGMVSIALNKKSLFNKMENYEK